MKSEGLRSSKKSHGIKDGLLRMCGGDLGQCSVCCAFTSHSAVAPDKSISDGLAVEAVSVCGLIKQPPWVPGVGVCDFVLEFILMILVARAWNRSYALMCKNGFLPLKRKYDAKIQVLYLFTVTKCCRRQLLMGWGSVEEGVKLLMEQIT